jgi:outer membrane protein
LIEQAPQAIIATQVIENEFKLRKQRLISLQKKIDQKTSKFMKEKDILSKEKQQKSSMALQNMRDGMNALETEFQTDYLIRQKEEMDKFFNIVKQQVKDISNDKKYLIIIHKESVFWANNNLDITDKVLSMLNKKKID